MASRAGLRGEEAQEFALPQSHPPGCSRNPRRPMIFVARDQQAGVRFRVTRVQAKAANLAAIVDQQGLGDRHGRSGNNQSVQVDWRPAMIPEQSERFLAAIRCIPDYLTPRIDAIG